MQAMPLAFPVFASTMMWLATAFERSVSLPVFAAAGMVEPGLLKYE
jgi:hypothetical protein